MDDLPEKTDVPAKEDISMAPRKARKFLKNIVVFSISFCAVFFAATFIAICLGAEGTELNRTCYYVALVFGIELTICGIVKLVGDKMDIANIANMVKGITLK